MELFYRATASAPAEAPTLVVSTWQKWIKKQLHVTTECEQSIDVDRPGERSPE